MRSHTMKLLLSALALAGCTADSPVGPVVDTPTPAFLIGSSPLLPVFLPVSDDATGVMIGAYIEFPIDLNKGITNAAAQDRFLIRSHIDFTTQPAGKSIASLATKDDPVASTDPKDGGLRKGSTVPFDVSVPLSDDSFLALLLEPADASANAGVSLVLKTGSGGEKILDGAIGSALITPKDNAVFVEAAAAEVETTEDPSGVLSRNALLSVYMSAVLADAIAGGQAGFNGFAEFSRNGDPVALGDPHPSPVVSSTVKNDDVALVVIAVPIDDATWAAVDAAAPTKGDVLDIIICIELVLPDTGSGEATLMTFESTGKTDPQTDGLPSKQEDDGSGK
jgi:hypothetical protein